jgi:hypothetical protein
MDVSKDAPLLAIAKLAKRHSAPQLPAEPEPRPQRTGQSPHDLCGGATTQLLCSALGLTAGGPHTHCCAEPCANKFRSGNAWPWNTLGPSGASWPGMLALRSGILDVHWLPARGSVGGERVSASGPLSLPCIGHKTTPVLFLYALPQPQYESWQQ